MEGGNLPGPLDRLPSQAVPITPDCTVVKRALQ